jgi:hypothetical protein
MSPKEVLGAIGLWVGVYLSLFLSERSFIALGVVLVFCLIILPIVLIVYIVAMIRRRIGFYGREVFLQIFLMTVCFIFAFLTAGWLWGPGSVFFGMVISLPLALFYFELQVLMQTRMNQKT